MARPTTSLKIETDALKRALEAHDVSVTDLADQLGVERQSVHNWFNKGSIPPRHLSSLCRKLGFTASEINALRPRAIIDVRFRTIRNVAVDKSIVEQVTDFARTVFLLEQSFTAPRADGYRKLPKKGLESPEEVASFILKQFNIPQYPLSLEQIIRALLVHGIPVIFCPFWSELHDAKIKAFTAYKGNDSIIFVDSNTAFEDIPWLIFHELTHIVRDDGDQVTATIEKFCNSVANEVCTPMSFFAEHKEHIQKNLEHSTLPGTVLFIRELAALLGASFKGTTLRLKDTGIVSSKSAIFRYLSKVASNEDRKRPKIKDLILPKPGERIANWLPILNDPSKNYLLRLQFLVCDSLIQGKISQSRAAEILGIDEIDAAELIASWAVEYNDTSIN